MRIDKTTYKDKEENQIGMTADHTSRPDKVLFFADPHFLFFKSQYTNGTFPFAQHTRQLYAKVKEPLPQKNSFNLIPIINTTRLPKSDKSRHNLNFRKMKKTVQLVAAIVAASIFSSCGGGGDSISEVKLIPVKSGKEFQYIDKEGKIVISPQFKNATVFRDGLALVETSGDEPKFGFITDDGKYAIKAQYKEATVFSDGLAWVVSENAAPTAIDKKGETKFTLQDAEEVRLFKDGLAAFSMVNEEGDEKWGFVDKTGKVVINPQFKSVSNFSDGLCGVRNDDGKWGFINKEGTITINYQFDEANDFKKGKCIVTSSNKDGVIDKDGKYIINPQFSDMQIDGDIFLVNQDGKWGWCDKDGKLIINPQFGEAYPFNGNKITSVQSGKSYGYIDRDGKIVINPQFDVALPFNGKLALVVSASKIGFIDKEGKYVINPQFDDVSRDLVQYFLTGGSEYSSVNTDYFNVGAITSVLNFDSPEGFTFNSTFDDVMKKYELQERKFGKYSSEHEVLSSKKITNDASYSFYVLGSAYDKITVTKGSGWYTYKDTEYKFNGKNEPTGFAYSISLRGKGYGKEEAVISAIEGKLSGYKKDENKSFDDVSVYSDGKKEIIIAMNSGDIVIVISAATSEQDFDDMSEYESAEQEEEYVD
jgi:hypothetical protein